MEPLNINASTFCKKVGIAYDSALMQKLRDLGLIRFFKMGKKYMYYNEDSKKLSDMLRENKISIKTSNGYYVTIND